MKDTAHLKGFGQLATLLIAQKVRPSQAFRFASFVEKLIRTRGPKGALIWLDSFGSLVSEITLGLAPKEPRPTWVDRNYVLQFKRGESKTLLQRMTKIKRHIQVKTPTPEQVSKFLNAVGRECVDEVAFHIAKAHSCRGMETMSQLFPKNHSVSPSNAWVAYVKRELSKGVSPKEAYDRALVRLHRDLWSMRQLSYFRDSEVFKLTLEALEPLSWTEVKRLLDTEPQGSEPPTCVGTIHGTQEPGMKLRVFASPLLVLQCIMEPLKVYYMNALRVLDNDACFSQEGAVSTVLSWVSQGMTTWSFDLSNATDRFPRTLSYACHNLIPFSRSEIFRTFRYVSEDKWIVSKELATYFGCDQISWTVGQPLGTGPSFGAFSLAHHALVRGICLHHGASLESYVILGDDIVINNKLVASTYRWIMESIGVPISESKSIVSDRFAEFAGFTVTRDGYFRPGKWREISPDSLLSFVTDESYDHTRVVPKFWIPLIKRMKEQPYPYGLYRPDLGGLEHEDVRQYASHICFAFLKSLSMKEATEELGSRYSLYTDKWLLSEFLLHSDIMSLIYEITDETEQHQRLLRVERRNSEMRAKYAGTSVVSQSFEPESAFCRTVFRWFSIEDNLGRIQTPLRISSSESDLPSRRVRQEAIDQVLGNLRLHLDKDVLGDVETFTSLIYSVIASHSKKVLDYYYLTARQMTYHWIEGTPFIKRLFNSRLVDPTPLELVRDMICAFPYYGIEDYSSTPTKFITTLRRYAKQKDVLPSLRTPMPRRKTGVR